MKPARRAVAQVGLAVLGGAGLTLAFPGYDLWWLAPIALAALALALRGAGVRRGFGLGWLAGLAYFVPTLSWAGTDFLGVVPWLGLATSQAMFVGLFGAVVGGAQRDQIRPFVGALAWVAQEALRARIPYGGFPWARVAFSQADSPLGRLAALGGAPGVALVTALVGGLLAAALVSGWPALRGEAEIPEVGRPAAGGRGRPGRRWTVTSRLALAGQLTVGGLLVPLPTDGPSAHVVAVQGNVPRPGLDFNAERRAVLDLHVAATVRAAQQRQAAGRPNPDLVVWPENSSDIDPTRNPDADAQIRLAVDSAGAPLLVGALLAEPAPQISNVTLLYLPGQGSTGRYVKQHPVPFAEYIPDRWLFRRISGAVDLLPQDMAAGDRPGIFRVPRAGGGELVAGVSICFEVASDDLVRVNVEQGADLLVVQTNNATFGWSHESAQQLAISRIRAIEHGRSVVHVSTVGVSALVRPDGTLDGPTTLFTTAVLDADLPLRAAPTLATRVGAWPEYLAVLALLVLVMRHGRVGRRRKDLSSP